MDITRARELLAVLADGINPLTGEILPDEDSCNQVEIVRALNTAVVELDKLVARRSRPQPENAGKPWTEEEDNLLIKEYQSGNTAVDISKLHSRSKGAIAARLVHLGLISDRYAVR